MPMEAKNGMLISGYGVGMGFMVTHCPQKKNPVVAKQLMGAMLKLKAQDACDPGHNCNLNE